MYKLFKENEFKLFEERYICELLFKGEYVYESLKKSCIYKLYKEEKWIFKLRQ